MPPTHPLPQTPPIVTEKGEPTTNTTTSPRFTEFLRTPRGTAVPTGRRKIVGVDIPLSSDVEEAEPEVDGTKEPAEHAENNDLEADLSTDTLSGLGGETDSEIVQQVTITRREAIALTNVLDKIPRTVMQQDNQTTIDNITLTVVDKPSNPPEPNVQDDEQGGSAELPSGDTRPNPGPDDRPVLRGKRRRPKYSLTTAMLKKHPVVQYFATGPLDRSKDPYKWWCRVCRIELSLMSRGVLELLSLFRTETHLLKEHRIRLETPGLPLFDQNENELHGGVTRSQEKSQGVPSHRPQLDSCRLLVGQDRLSEFSSTTNPSESVLAQICILEHGLRHGGHVDFLLGIWEDMTRLTPGSSAQTTTHNWAKHRHYVSITLHQMLRRITSLFFKRLSCLGHHNLHVPRTDALLCSYNWHYWSLFIVVPEFFFCQLSLLEFLVRQHLLSSMFGVWTTRDSFTQEDSHFNLLLTEPVRESAQLLQPNQFRRKAQH